MASNECVLVPVILCGGSGSRLWPLSREYFPKQLLNLGLNQSLLQETVARLDGFTGKGLSVMSPLLVANENQRFMVAEQLRSMDCSEFKLLIEPVAKNTAPALAIAAHRARVAGDPILLVMPSDHRITELAEFQGSVGRAIAEAEQGKLIVFGVKPTRPETGYGYIEVGAPISSGVTALNSFTEKPDLEKAEAFLASGDYLWNSGIFMFKASVFLEALREFAPEIYEATRLSVENAVEDLDFVRVDREAFEACPSDSIDYAVMERLSSEGNRDFAGSVVELASDWTDLGSFESLWHVSNKDENQNVISGDVIALDTTDSLVMAENKLVSTIGLKEMIVVETSDAVLIAPIAQSQRVKEVVEMLKKQDREQYKTHRVTYRPWGSYEPLDLGERYQVKRIVVKPQCSLSLQMHHHRAEHWIVVKGTAKVTRGDESFLLGENESTYIPLGVTHRLENPGIVPLEIIEVQSGTYLGEDDIVRLEDIYGR